MPNDRIITSQVADHVKNQIDMYRAAGTIDNTTYERLSSFAVLISAINEADIAICSILKQEKFTTVYVLSGERIVYMSGNAYQEGEFIAALADLDLADVNEATLLNKKPWTEVGQLRSSKIGYHRSYPHAGDRPDGYFTLCGLNEFQESEDNNKAYYNPYDNSLMLPRAFDTDHFLSFVAIAEPVRIDHTEFTDGSFNDYEITSPVIAKKALITQTLSELMPIGTELHGTLMSYAEKEKYNVLSRTRKNHATLTVKPSF